MFFVEQKFKNIFQPKCHCFLKQLKISKLAMSFTVTKRYCLIGQCQSMSVFRDSKF